MLTITQQVDTITAVKQFMSENKRLSSVGNNSEALSETTIPMATVAVPAHKSSRFPSLSRILGKSVKTLLVVPSDPKLKSYSRTRPPQGSSTRGIKKSVPLDSNTVAEPGPSRPNTTVSMSLKARGKQPVEGAFDSRASI